MKTLQDKFAKVLILRGEIEVPSRSGKYRTFTRTKGGFYFLGKSGALRFGRCASHSYAVSEKVKKAYLAMLSPVPATAPHAADVPYVGDLSAPGKAPKTEEKRSRRSCNQNYE